MWTCTLMQFCIHLYFLCKNSENNWVEILSFFISEFTFNERAVFLPREKSKETESHDSIILTFYLTNKQIGKQEMQEVLCSLGRHLLHAQCETYFALNISIGATRKINIGKIPGILGSFCIEFHIEIHPFAIDAGFWRATEARKGNTDNLTLLTQNNKNKSSLELYIAQRH